MGNRRRRDDPIGVVEAAYALALDDRAWLSGLLEVVASDLDRGFGLAGVFFDVDGDDRVTLHTPVGRGSELPLDRLAGVVAERASPSLVRRVFVFGPTAGSLEDLRAWGFLDEGELARARDALQTAGLGEVLGLRAFDPDSRAGLLLLAPSPEPSRAPPGFVDRWERLSEHVAAGLRVRRALALREEPAGAVVRLEEPAESEPPDARAALRDAIREQEKEDGQGQRVSSRRALALWRGLADGKWSLVDYFDQDGKRYVVARRNDPHVRDPRALTPREREVSVFLARGHSNKHAAYELGVSISTVAHHVRSILGKLGLGSRVELVRLLRQLRVDRLVKEEA